MGLTRSQLLSALDLREQTVALPAWGGAVHIRELTAAERLAASDAEDAAKGERATYNEHTKSVFWAHVIVAGVLDEPGGRALFSAADIPTLTARRLDRLEELGTRIWVWSEAHPAALKSVGAEADPGQLDAPGRAEGAGADGGAG